MQPHYHKYIVFSLLVYLVSFGRSKFQDINSADVIIGVAPLLALKGSHEPLIKLNKLKTSIYGICVSQSRECLPTQNPAFITLLQGATSHEFQLSPYRPPYFWFVRLKHFNKQFQLVTCCQRMPIYPKKLAQFLKDKN